MKILFQGDSIIDAGRAIDNDVNVGVMDFSKLKNCMEKFVQEYNIPGVDCMVYKDHEVIF